MELWLRSGTLLVKEGKQVFDEQAGGRGPPACEPLHELSANPDAQIDSAGMPHLEDGFSSGGGFQ